MGFRIFRFGCGQRPRKASTGFIPVAASVHRGQLHAVTARGWASTGFIPVGPQLASYRHSRTPYRSRHRRTIRPARLRDRIKPRPVLASASRRFWLPSLAATGTLRIRLVMAAHSPQPAENGLAGSEWGEWWGEGVSTRRPAGSRRRWVARRDSLPEPSAHFLTSPLFRFPTATRVPLVCGAVWVLYRAWTRVRRADIMPSPGLGSAWGARALPLATVSTCSLAA